MVTLPRAALISLALIAGGCAASEPPGPKTPATPAGFPEEDAPLELADDRDLAVVADRFEATPLSDDGRAELRARLAAEYTRRARASLEAGDRPEAYDALTSLLGLWHPRELRSPTPGLGEHRQLLRSAREAFARAGRERETAVLLYALAFADPERAERYRSELDELFAFADELAVAEYGDGAQRARPIEILEHAIEVFPAPPVLERLVDLYVERQAELGSQFRRRGAELRIIQAHGEGVLNATRAIVRAHAHAYRLGEALEPAEAITNFGDDAELRGALERALAGDAGASERSSAEGDGDGAGGAPKDAEDEDGAPATEGSANAGEAGASEEGAERNEAEAERTEAWLAIAEALAGGGERGDGDPKAARRACEQAARATPRNPSLHLCVAERAVETDNAALAARHYERALALEPDAREAADQLAGVYEHRVGRAAFDQRPHRAAEFLSSLKELDARARERWPDERLAYTRTDGYAAMGRGLAGMGALDAARAYLRRSASSGHIRALEHLGIIEKKRGRPERALAFFERAADQHADTPEERFDRARALRLASEAAEAAGEGRRAARENLAAREAWEALARDLGRLRDSYEGEKLVEIGKLRWATDNREAAIDAFRRAAKADPDGAATHARITAFLLVRGERGLALDIYHRAVANPEIDDYFKVYMSLWLAVDAELRGLPLDPVAARYLEERSGPLWHDKLARWVTGRADLDELAAEADTPGRRAELFYYRAMLREKGRDPERAKALLRRVVGTEMVLFFEYDMARHWLEHGFAVAE